MCSSVAECGEYEYVIHQKMGGGSDGPVDDLAGQIGRTGRVGLRYFGADCGFSDDLTWKLGARGWFAGGAVAALLAIVMYLEDAAAARKQ